MRLEHDGVTVELPRGWEAEARDRPYDSPRRMGLGVASFDPAPEREALVTLHLANFPLPLERGDYGSGAVEQMGADSVFVSLLEFGPESVGTALFAHEGLPLPLLPDQFSPNQLQRPQVDQVGYQGFFSVAGRAFCVYVVLGDGRRASQLAADANEALASVRFG
ncbi:MAG: hypothetical protein OEY23_18085 [Acidimicrobiia bacterium]|nr:hypothetical protein [Acidimicrobiia bacterium]